MVVLLQEKVSHGELGFCGDGIGMFLFSWGLNPDLAHGRESGLSTAPAHLFWGFDLVLFFSRQGFSV